MTDKILRATTYDSQSLSQQLHDRLEGEKQDAKKHPIQYHPDHSREAEGYNTGYNVALSKAQEIIKEVLGE